MTEKIKLLATSYKLKKPISHYLPRAHGWTSIDHNIRSGMSFLGSIQ